ncbi:TPA: hypothetical protein L5P98_006230, partial [Pseudomonas aeruginosa]|nr:hypothetical protein [Pseudomonas aeruginosa]
MKALIGIGLCAALLGGCAALPGRDGPRECSQQLGQEQELHGDVSCRYQGIVLRGFAGWLRAFLCFLYQFRTSFNPG